MKKIFLLFVVCYVLIVAVPSFAAETPYTLLAPIPLEGAGAGDTQTTVASQYIRGIFMLTIGLATGLAVIMIIFGGIKYMSTDAFTGKSEAREIIQNAIWGLLLVISAWLILSTINPKLVNFNLNIPIQAIRSAVTGGTPTPSAGCPNCVKISVLNNKLIELQRRYGTFTVNESYPPTTIVEHTAPCHGNGTCVDASIPFSTPQNIKSFINDASRDNLGLRAVYEVKTLERAQEIRQANGLSETQVIVVPKINGEHFSIYKN